MQGILFKPDMIQAIIEGRKTQTRRVIKPQPDRIVNGLPYRILLSNGGGDVVKLIKPRYQVGETVYVKEAWQIRDCGKAVSLSIETWPKGWPVSRVEYDNLYDFSKRSPFFMPEWAARYFTTITDVRAERLRIITLGDAIAEGFTSVEEFLEAFIKINHLEEDANPWDFAYTFKQDKEKMR